jgi:putative oxidoreductase
MKLAMISENVFSPMSTSSLLELFGGFMAACVALWFVAMNRFVAMDGPATSPAPLAGLTAVAPALRAYLQRPGLLASVGLLLLRLSIGGLMIHHGQEKLADPQQFANTYVASLHLPFPLFFAYAAGFSELIGSWLVILGLLTPLGALALTGTMLVAAYQHISTAGFNIYVLELVLLYLGGSLALLCNGPGRFSFDAGIVPALLDDLSDASASVPVSTQGADELQVVPVTVNTSPRG